MVDFSKKIKNIKKEVVTNPIEIYNSLDRQTTKVGPLRDGQKSVLDDWFNNKISNKDIVLKLNTGAGKTIVGLLMLESRRRLNSGVEIFLCNDKNLINQTVSQAKSFGIEVDIISDDNNIPDEVIAGEKILVSSVQKFFNGKSIFNKEENHLVDGLVIDDAHTSAEIIKRSCIMNIQKNENSQLYADLFNLLSDGLQSQGYGKFEDIKNGVNDNEDILPVPYWTWIDKIEEITKIISAANNKNNNLSFVWPLLKDKMKYCNCVFSKSEIEIQPIKYPIDFYKNFIDAKQRIFMSATTASDAVLINDLNVSINAIKNPLTYDHEKWSGEKMMIVPSIISDNLNRSLIVKLFGSAYRNDFGMTAIVPSYYKTNDWKKYGALIGDKENLENILNDFHNKKFSKPLVLVNRYDGIDLPDEETRILIIDSLPKSSSLMDQYIESVVPNGSEHKLRTAQKIEQGTGRSVRADTDYSIVIFTGSDLVRFIRDPQTQQYFSEQTLMQLQIGIENSQEANKEITNDSPKEQINTLFSLMSKAIKRDPDWKSYYKEQMEEVKYSSNTYKNIEHFHEKNNILKQAVDPAINIDSFNESIDDFIKKYDLSQNEEGWYLQLKAHINYYYSKIDAEKYQIEAHEKNASLLLNENNNNIKKINTLNASKRIENIIETIKTYENYENFHNSVEEIASNLSFGTDSKYFEPSFDELGKIIGFETSRPDNDLKKGPDHLWGVKDNTYFIIEDKSEVKENRDKINKHESGQMNNSIGWFKNNYQSSKYFALLIIPTRYPDSAAGFIDDVNIIRKKKLKRLRYNFINFAKEFKNFDFNSLSSTNVQQILQKHELEIDSFIDQYSEPYVK